MIRHVRHHVGGDWPIIGVGGISSSQDALEKMKAGATLVQAYSGFVFEGPSLVKSVVHGLNQSMNAEGYTSLQSVIGVDEQPK
jgi:dihydroorotate dehydrogenase